MKKISFVIPCYNSEHTIGDVVAEIDRCFWENGKYRYEIVLVNDGSPKDDTLGAIRKIAKEKKHVKAVNLSKNFGQDSALMAGYSVAEGDYIISLDDDGQNPAAESWKLLGKLEEGWDVAFGRYHVKKHSRLKNFGSRVNDKMAVWLLDKPEDLRLCSYFAMQRFVAEQMLKDKNAFPYIWGLMLRATDSMTNVYIEHRERQEGVSNFTFRKSLKVWLNGFIAFSVKPLRISAFIGCFIALLGFLYGIYVVIKKIFFFEPETGWSSLMVAVLLIGGIILAMLGLLGEYIGRMNISVNNTPQFIIRDITGGGGAGASVPGVSDAGGMSVPGASVAAGASGPGVSDAGGASVPGASVAAGASGPGVSDAGGASVPGISGAAGASGGKAAEAGGADG